MSLDLDELADIPMPTSSSADLQTASSSNAQSPAPQADSLKPPPPPNEPPTDLPTESKKNRQTPLSPRRVSTKDNGSSRRRKSRSRSGSPRRRYSNRTIENRSYGYSLSNRRDRNRNDYARRDDGSRKREFDRDLIYGRRRSRSRSNSRERYRKRRRSGSRDASPTTEFEKLARKERMEREKARKDGLPFGAPPTAAGVSSHSGTPSRMISDKPEGSPSSSLDPELTRTIEQMISKRVDDEVQARARDVETEIQKRVAAAKLDSETRIRQQVEAELRDEMAACEKREADAKQKCEQLERQLKAKMDELEDARKKLDEERLEMLESKRKLDEERNQVRKEKEKMAKEEQKVILGKGGSRQKVEFSLNRKL